MPAPVLIAGGGPVGLIVALVLGRAGIDVELFDKGDIVHSEPRAATIHPATLDILDDLGIYSLIEPQGVVCPIVNYYDGKLLLASFDHALIKDATRHPWVLQCEQDKLSRTVFGMLKAVPKVRCHTGAKVVGVSEVSDGVEIEVETAEGERTRHTGAWLVGADGAGSTVRKLAGIEFEGFTYPERFMIAGTTYDFAQEGYAYRNYVADPDEWYNLFKISWSGPPGVFRLVSPVYPHEPYEGPEALEMAQRKMQRFCPNRRKYDIVVYDSYVVSQRVAATFRKGRILLAGDSAHLNSPIGAMGMNSGIHDAVSLAGNMIRVIMREEGEGALDRYVRQRRHVATHHVQTATIANKQAMEQKDPARRQQYRDHMRHICGEDQLARQFLLRTSLIESLQDAARVA
jgi:3-(3-hydroxy-phenyl)propionate hydroxylase